MTAVVQSWLSSRTKALERSFQERKEAYIGLLEAYHRAAVNGTDESAKSFAYWQMRCEIVGPQPVRDSIEEIIASNTDRKGRSHAHEKLKSSIRKDLGITSE
ncbi:hypothetical protein [Leisingera sp. F5]|uniref:hypothetical protein n=1 Tax=Leisingera sp. F5 TaxID=1813816 RepID=UPI0025C65EA6|nr:hypothetical protein [Leisingera sp. F5]